MTRSTLLVAAAALALAACATTTTGVDRERTGHAVIHLDPASAVTTDASPAFPAPLGEHRLPSADRLGPQLTTELGGQASVDVRLCVAPDGRVASVELERGSNLPAFDEAVRRDARAWRFAAQPGPSTVKACERATIAYRAR
jgi:TonB family protein